VNSTPATFHGTWDANPVQFTAKRAPLGDQVGARIEFTNNRVHEQQEQKKASPGPTTQV
jgi:hypothetical protein